MIIRFGSQPKIPLIPWRLFLQNNTLRPGVGHASIVKGIPGSPAHITIFHPTRTGHVIASVNALRQQSAVGTSPGSHGVRGDLSDVVAGQEASVGLARLCGVPKLQGVPGLSTESAKDVVAFGTDHAPAIALIRGGGFCG